MAAGLILIITFNGTFLISAFTEMAYLFLIPIPTIFLRATRIFHSIRLKQILNYRLKKSPYPQAGKSIFYAIAQMSGYIK